MVPQFNGVHYGRGLPSDSQERVTQRDHSARLGDDEPAGTASTDFQHTADAGSAVPESCTGGCTVAGGVSCSYCRTKDANVLALFDMVVGTEGKSHEDRWYPS